jgi:hypothetical protein
MGEAKVLLSLWLHYLTEAGSEAGLKRVWVGSKYGLNGGLT